MTFDHDCATSITARQGEREGSARSLLHHSFRLTNAAEVEWRRQACTVEINSLPYTVYCSKNAGPSNVRRDSRFSNDHHYSKFKYGCLRNVIQIGGF